MKTIIIIILDRIKWIGFIEKLVDMTWFSKFFKDSKVSMIILK